MKIIYVNCGVKNFMKVDHRSYDATFAVAKIIIIIIIIIRRRRRRRRRGRRRRNRH